LLPGWGLELLPCSFSCNDQDAEHVHRSGFVPLAAEHRAYQEGDVASEARVGAQTGGQFLKALRGSDWKPFLLQKHQQILDIRLEALRYLHKLRRQKHLG
jgi:hypothetical protein